MCPTVSSSVVLQVLYCSPDKSSVSFDHLDDEEVEFMVLSTGHIVIPRDFDPTSKSL